MPVTLVTGTSTGIGFATALHLALHGHTVVATMRNLARAGPLEAAAREQGVHLAVRELDVTDQASIDRAMAETRAREGAVDGHSGATTYLITQISPLESPETSAPKASRSSGDFTNRWVAQPTAPALAR